MLQTFAKRISILLEVCFDFVNLPEHLASGLVRQCFVGVGYGLTHLVRCNKMYGIDVVPGTFQYGRQRIVVEHTTQTIPLTAGVVAPECPFTLFIPRGQDTIPCIVPISHVLFWFWFIVISASVKGDNWPTKALGLTDGSKSFDRRIRSWTIETDCFEIFCAAFIQQHVDVAAYQGPRINRG